MLAVCLHCSTCWHTVKPSDSWMVPMCFAALLSHGCCMLMLYCSWCSTVRCIQCSILCADCYIVTSHKSKKCLTARRTAVRDAHCNFAILCKFALPDSPHLLVTDGSKFQHADSAAAGRGMSPVAAWTADVEGAAARCGLEAVAVWTTAADDPSVRACMASCLDSDRA